MCMIDYYIRVESFINYVIYNLRNISGSVLDVHVRAVKKYFTIQMLL